MLLNPIGCLRFSTFLQAFECFAHISYCLWVLLIHNLLTIGKANNIASSKSGHVTAGEVSNPCDSGQYSSKLLIISDINKFIYPHVWVGY
jgi:hypothetical protein